MRRSIFFAYGIACYLLFIVVYAYMAGFVGNFFVPKSIDSPSESSMGPAVAADCALLLLFALQHSIMARPKFKSIWTKIVPQPIERSTYVLLSNVALMLLMWQWRSIPISLWDLRDSVGRSVMIALFATGWLLVPIVSLMINHLDLFGIRQVWLHLRKREYSALPFHTPMLYGYVRHPLYVSWFLAFWMTPTMTAGHLLFASVLTGYMLLASKIEERDLADHFGHLYEDYRCQVPAFVPRMGSRKAKESKQAEPSLTIG